MSKAKDFRKAHDALLEDAHAAVDAIRVKTDEALEELAVQLFGSVDGKGGDGYGPPEIPCQVECWHCDERYSSSEMRLAYRPRMQEAYVESLGNGFSKLEPLWWCRNSDCDGGGFGCDIHPVRPRKTSKAKRAETIQ